MKPANWQLLRSMGTASTLVFSSALAFYQLDKRVVEPRFGNNKTDAPSDNFTDKVIKPPKQ